MQCPECAKDSTAVRTVHSEHTTVPMATYALMAMSIIVFAAEALGGGDALSTSGGTFLREGGLFGPAIDQGGEWWRIVTSGFLHAGVFHLFLNMFVLYVLGTLLEPAIGSVRFVAIYFVSLLAGSFGALVLDPDALTVGASGAVYGLMAATFVIARRRGIESVASSIGIWLALNLVFTFSVPGISIGGHLGGLVGGLLAAVAIIGTEYGLPRRVGTALTAVLLVGLGAASVVGALWAAGQPAGL